MLATVYALAVSPWSGAYLDYYTYIVPFWIFFGLALISVLYSFCHYRGRRLLVHGLLLLLLPSAAWIWFVGTVLVTHDGP